MTDLEWEYRFATLSVHAYQRVWRQYRLIEICAGNTGAKVSGRPAVVLHVFGLPTFVTATELLERKAPSLFAAAHLGESRDRWTVDGPLETSETGYLQHFRDGRAEYVSKSTSDVVTNGQARIATPGSILNAIDRFVAVVPGEAQLALTLLHLKGYRLSTHFSNLVDQPHYGFDRDVVIFPSLPAATASKSLHHLLWEATGHAIPPE